jgi:2,4-dienoyl-CoA reductase-like NADH-dependent reductase (Old Yellow Enzyme family)
MQRFVDRRWFFLAVNTGYVQGQLPDSRCVDFYTARSGNGLYCAIVGNAVISRGTGSNVSCARISEAPQWKELSQSIAGRGALPGIQLATAWPGYAGHRRFVSRSRAAQFGVYRAVASSMTVSDISDAFDDLIHSTNVALKSGFRHIQLHAAHGYFFNLCLHPALCRHAGYALQRARDWVNLVRSAGAESSIRMSTFAGHKALDTQWKRAASPLLELTADYFDVSEGFYNLDKRLIYPSTPDLLTARIARTLELARAYPSHSFIVSGRALGALSEVPGPNVHIGVCRDLIANPNFLDDQSHGCTNSMECHYFSRGERYLTCGMWTHQNTGWLSL